MENALLRIDQAAEYTACRRAGFYQKVSDGLMPTSVSIGGKRRAWPRRELEAINEARIRGASDDEVRALVVELETMRRGTPATPRRNERLLRLEQLKAAQPAHQA